MIKPLSFLQSVRFLCLVTTLSRIAFAQEPTTTAFLHANLISMESDSVAPNQTVLVVEGKIASVGADGSVAVPANARLIDATGKYLLPGLTDMHAHVYEPE